MRKSISAVLCTALFALIAAVSAQPSNAAVPNEKRVALVIGNGNYKNTVALPNTLMDARAMEQALQRLGFDVVSGVDVSREGMVQVMKTFARKVEGADVGLFFYAGHGMQVGGENYLIPVDAELKHETDLQYEAIKVQQIVERMSEAARIKLVILDSCRDNPLAQTLARSMRSASRSMAPSSGMAPIQSSASGTLIAFATAPGHVALDGEGQHSPFTTALLEHIETPGLDVDVMMKRVRGQVARSTGDSQQPWTNSALNGEFYLKPAAHTSETATAPAEPTTRVASLEPTTTPIAPAAAPAQARGLSDDTRAQIDLAAWNFAHKDGAGSRTDYETYLQRFPTGLFAQMARDQILRLSNGANPATAPTGGQVVAAATGSQSDPYAPRTIGTEATEQALGLSRSDWRKLQRQLSDLGFSTRGVDGSPGDGTRSAVRDWQKARGYEPTGFLDDKQRTALLIEPTPESRNTASTSSDAAPTRRRVTRSADSDSDAPRSQSRQKSDADMTKVLGAAIAIGGAIAIGRALRR